MSITALPTPPQIVDDASTFNSRAFAWVVALGTFTTEINALGATVLANANTAASAATAATTKAGEAAASASAAAGSATTASAKAGEANASAVAAAGAASTATTQAGAASTSASAAASNAAAVASALASIAGGPVVSINGLTGIVTLTPAALGAEPASPDILRTSHIGVSVQAYAAGLAPWAAKGAPVGTVVGTTDAQSLTNKTLASGSVWNGGAISVRYGGTGVATLAGLVKGNGDAAFSAAVAGTDYIAPGGALGTPGSGNLSNCTADGTNSIGYRNIPQLIKSAAYTLQATEAGKHILHPAADTTARTFTIPANSSVAYPIGTALTFINQHSAGVVTIAITTDTMRLAGTGATGSRTLAANGIATAIKISATEWIISGTGLT